MPTNQPPRNQLPIPGKNCHNSLKEGWIQFMDITAIDSISLAGAIAPGAWEQFVISPRLIQANGCEIVEVMLASNVAGAAPTMQLISYPIEGPHVVARGSGGTKDITQALGNVLLSGAMTFSGNTVVGFNPFTNLATAGVTWSLASAIGANVNDRRAWLTPSSAILTMDMSVDVDTRGGGPLFLRVSNLDTATRLIGAYRRLQ